MLSQTLLALAGAAIGVAALPSGGKGGYGGGHGDYGLGDSLIAETDFTQKDARESVSYKEICYRNLYADVASFHLRTAKEVALEDAGNSDVFLFAAVKKDYQDKEFYYEEFCYKQTHKKEHNSKVNAESVVVGLKEKRDGGLGLDGGLDGGIGGYGGGLSGGFSQGGIGGGIGSYGGFDGLGSLDSSSFLSGGWGNDGLNGGFDGSSLSSYGGGFDGGFKGDGGYGSGYDHGFDSGFDNGFDGGKGGYHKA